MIFKHTIEVFCCQNSSCPDYGNRDNGNLSFCGWSGKSKKIRMILCHTCKTHFSERKGTSLEGCKLPEETAISLFEH